MGETLLVRILEAVRRVIAERTSELDALDAAIGDGDHGTNLARGLAAVRPDEVAQLGFGEALARVASVLGAETGGDGGRLYAALCRGMAAAADGPPADLAALARLVDAGVAAVRDAGGARAGEKTMLDVLESVADVLRADAASGRADGMGSRVVAAAAFGLHRTSRLIARHGRAADLGTASINHLDPGAWSSALIVGAAVAVLEPTPAPA